MLLLTMLSKLTHPYTMLMNPTSLQGLGARRCAGLPHHHHPHVSVLQIRDRVALAPNRAAYTGLPAYTSAFAARRPSMHTQAVASPQQAHQQPCRIAIAITATSIDAFLAEIAEAEAAGADIVELRLDFIVGFNTEMHLQQLMAACTKPFIVTYRPIWEG